MLDRLLIVIKGFDSVNIDKYKLKNANTVVDNIVFVVFTAVLVCRLFVNEVFPSSEPLVGENAGGGIVGFGGLSFMLSFDIVLLLGCGIWLILKLKFGDLLWRKTGMACPFVLLVIATVLSYISASDKSVGLVSGLNLLSMMAAGLVMVQLLGSDTKRKILLAVVLAMGVCEVLRCYEQQGEHEDTVSQMESDYNGFMHKQGLEPSSWQARQMEERVRSRDTGGYFAISNTAASFLLLTVAGAIAVLGAGGWKKGQVPISLIICAVLMLILMLGINLTDSTGGKLSLAAMFAAIAGMAILRKNRYRRVMFGLFILIIAGGTAAVAVYGNLYDRLPTSNLWIRWQYWQATAGMITDHWLTGVGPFNFDHYYSLYMNSSSPEVVKDPHCVPLAIFSQWGLLGIAAMVWATLAVLWKLVMPGRQSQLDDLELEESADNKYPIFEVCLTAVIMSISIFVIRMLSVEDSLGEMPTVAKMYLTLGPAITFGLIFLLFGYLFLCREEISLEVSGRRVLIPLLAGLAAFALHNTIDFAFFQPVVGMLFFMLAALAVSSKEGEIVIIRRKPIYLYACAAGVVVILLTAVLPGLGGGVYRTDKAMSQAEKYVIMAGRTRQLSYAEMAVDICLENADSCQNDSRSLLYAGRLCNQLWYNSELKKNKYFDTAVDSLLKAIERDPAHFKYDKLLGELYMKRGGQYKVGSEERKKNYDKAAGYFSDYLEKYPGNSDVLTMLADIKFEFGDIGQARNLAENALEIERGCMELQPKLFPHREVYYPRMDQELQKRAEEIASTDNRE